MTIPGKGGRPRKWRSDVDRQRAWRARQAGIDEPPTVGQALGDGDELARVWEIVRDLGEQLDQAKAALGEVCSERDQVRRERDRDWRRFGWFEARVADVEAERDRLEGERDALAVEIIEIREQLIRLTEPPTSHLPKPTSQRPRREVCHGHSVANWNVSNGAEAPDTRRVAGERLSDPSVRHPAN